MRESASAATPEKPFAELPLAMLSPGSPLIPNSRERFGRNPPLDADLFTVGDASNPESWGDKYDLDLVYSEDVFEHIPLAGLEGICRLVSERLAPGGLFVVNVNLFTGVTGGHVPEWYHHRVELSEQKRTRPWEHLRSDKPVADTYLNRLLVSDYDQLFAERFDIRERRELYPNLGKEFLTPEIEEELRLFSREELLTNNLRYVLTPKRA